MSLVLNVYVKKIDETIIPKWIKKMNEFDMECEFHPNFSFKDSSGFLPFKIKFSNHKNPNLNSKELISGFEIYINDFDFQSELLKLQPKKSFLDKLFNRQTETIEYANTEIDKKLANCKTVLSFVWGSHNSLELRMVSLASATLSELTNGICTYPADDIWYDNETIVKDAFNEILEYENSLKPNEWIIHEFNGWNE